jgi:phosphoenolpyruvate-protein phosphotransferase (PTS system enzyme I)
VSEAPPLPELAGSAVLTNAVGLHARPSVKLTQLAKRFGSTIELALAPAGPWLDAKSPVKVMRAKARKGATLYFRVRGPDASEALAAMLSLVERRFDEEPEHPPAPAPASGRSLPGVPAAPGLAIGPLFELRDAVAERAGSGDRQLEAAALRSAVAAALADLRRLVSGEGNARNERGEVAGILGSQIALLEDPALAERAYAAIAAGRAAHEAWLDTMAAEAAAYDSADDEYFRARAADVRDLRDQVLARLGGAAPAAQVPPGAIVAAVDLPPSRFLTIDWRNGGGLALTGGSPTSHVAMLARARGVPAVVGLGVPVPELAGEALLDGGRGVIIIEPTPAQREAFQRELEAQAIERAACEAARAAGAATRDGTPVRVLLNIASPAELDALDPAICDGIGLVRTELMLEDLPGEDVQHAAYRRIVEWAAGRPVTIRTLDAGGDKPIPGLTRPVEKNPFLGVRGLRLSFAAPAVFRTQLRALLRAAVHGDLKIMLPMVTLPRELLQARRMLDEELAALAAAGVPARRPRLGIMIEVPAAAIAADLFDADFFSIGSNDLTQYVAAAARDLAELAELADPTQPAVLRLIRNVVGVAAARGIDVSLCGDAGGDPAAIPALLGAGLRALSVAPALVGQTKRAIAGVDLAGHGRL